MKIRKTSNSKNVKRKPNLAVVAAIGAITLGVINLAACGHSSDVVATSEPTTESTIMAETTTVETTMTIAETQKEEETTKSTVDTQVSPSSETVTKETEDSASDNVDGANSADSVNTDSTQNGNDGYSSGFSGVYQVGGYALPCSINIDNYIDAGNNVDLYQMAIDAGFEAKYGSWIDDVRESDTYEMITANTLLWVFVEEALENGTGIDGRTPLGRVGVLFLDPETYAQRAFHSCYFSHHDSSKSVYKTFDKAWSLTREEIIAFAYLLENAPTHPVSDPFYGTEFEALKTQSNNDSSFYTLY